MRKHPIAEQHLFHFKDYLILLVLLVIMGSCGPNSSKLSSLCVDSLVMEHKTYYLDSITEKTYKEVKYIFPLSTDTAPMDPTTVIINRDSITVVSQDGPVVFNNDSTDSDAYANYQYVKTLDKIGFVHIQGSFYEWTYDYLVNLQSGTQQEFWMEPLFSPNRRAIISYSGCMETDEMPNGIQYFKVEHGEINKIFEVNIPDWEPNEIKWESDTSIVIKRAKLDKNFKKHFDYVRMVIKD